MTTSLIILGKFYRWILISGFDFLRYLSSWLGELWNFSLFGKTVVFFLIYTFLLLVFQILRNRINFKSEQRHAFQPLGNQRLSTICGIGVSLQFFPVFSFFIANDLAIVGVGVLSYFLFLFATYLYFWRKIKTALALQSILWLIAFIQLFSLTIYFMILYFHIGEKRIEKKRKLVSEKERLQATLDHTQSKKQTESTSKQEQDSSN